MRTRRESWGLCLRSQFVLSRRGKFSASEGTWHGFVMSVLKILPASGGGRPREPSGAGAAFLSLMTEAEPESPHEKIEKIDPPVISRVRSEGAATPRTGRVHSSTRTACVKDGVGPPAVRVDKEMASRAMSEAGSILSERMESAALAAAELLRTPLRCVAAGAICLVLPPAAVVLLPLIMLLMPLLVPIGCVLMFFGTVRAGYIISVSREQEEGAPLLTLTSAMASINTRAQNRLTNGSRHDPPSPEGSPDRSSSRARYRSSRLSATETPEEVRRERRATDGTLKVRRRRVMKAGSPRQRQ